jgi:hypothetical protein
MKQTRLTAVLIVLLAAASSYGLYEAGTSQRSRPPNSPPPQTAQPRRSAPPPQTAPPQQSTPPAQAGNAQETAPPRTAPPPQPSEGRTRPPATPPSGQAEQRPPQSGPEHGDHPDHGVVVRHPVYGWGGWYGYPWYPYTYPPWGYPLPPEMIAADWMTSNIKLDVSPKDAGLYVDGYYAGIVGDFGGFFHQLTLPAGPHHAETRKDGYCTLVLDVNLQPGQTITYKRTMERVRPTDVTPEEPPVVSDLAGDPEAFLQIPGTVRLDVTPKNAEVYADGYYAGIVDDFRGNAQHLILTPGPHHIELRAEAYGTLEFDVDIQPGQAVDYRNSLQRK